MTSDNAPAVPTGDPTVRRGRRPASPRPQVASVTPLAPRRRREDPVPKVSVQGTLALDLHGATDRSCGPSLHLVPDPPARAVHAWSGRFAQAVVEVLGGDRPLTQLVRWTSAEVYEDLARRLALLRRAPLPAPGRRVARPQVRSVHVFQPSARTAEVSVHVRYGPRSRALAARLEHVRGHWRCTSLQLG